MESKKRKNEVEKIEILDESTGQIILKEQSQFEFSPCSSSLLSKELKNCDQTSELENYNLSDSDEAKKSNIEFVDLSRPQILLLNQQSIDKNVVVACSSHSEIFNSMPNNSISSTSIKQNLINSGLSPHIVQNYSILAQEITAPLDKTQKLVSTESSSCSHSSNEFNNRNWNSHTTKTEKSANKNSNSSRSYKESATCQFCGLAMLKKNIPTHIRRAHTPKEELVCLNEEQNIFTFNYLKPGQRRKRSARAYDYSLMTATVSIDDDPSEGIENKFITEGEEILSTDLVQLADRIKYGISLIPVSTLNKLIDILSKIEYSTQDEICADAKSIRNMICFYLASGEEFKYKIRQVSEDIVEKKKQVSNLRTDLKEVMTRKAQLERRIQPLVCELQKLEDQHGDLIDSILPVNDFMQFDILKDQNDN